MGGMTAPAATRRERVIAASSLAVYLIALALIAFWPEHVDRGASTLIRAITRVLPWATHERIEFTSNIALFVPFGLLGALLLHRRIWLAIVAGLAISVFVELVQGAFLPGRTSSVWDVVANTLGTVIGVALAALVRRSARARRTRHR